MKAPQTDLAEASQVSVKGQADLKLSVIRALPHGPNSLISGTLNGRIRVEILTLVEAGASDGSGRSVLAAGVLTDGAFGLAAWATASH